MKKKLLPLLLLLTDRRMDRHFDFGRRELVIEVS